MAREVALSSAINTFIVAPAYPCYSFRRVRLKKLAFGAIKDAGGLLRFVLRHSRWLHENRVVTIICALYPCRSIGLLWRVTRLARSPILYYECAQPNVPRAR